MPSYKLILSYDGGPYFGWQKTRMGPSIQEMLEKALFQLAQETCKPEAASRTDRGVHAEGQVVQFYLKKSFSPFALKQALNAHLPVQIRVLEAQEIDSAFHPTLDASHKEYHYNLCLGPVQLPFYRLYSWHFPRPLDFEKMQQASFDLLGTHDFSALANEKEENPICTLEAIRFVSLPEERLQIQMVGNRFLYRMARNLAGTLVYIGCGKLSETIVPSLLAGKKRKEAGMTAPAHGLCLHRVFYGKIERDSIRIDHDL